MIWTKAPRVIWVGKWYNSVYTTPSIKPPPLYNFLIYSIYPLHKMRFWDIFIYPLYERGMRFRCHNPPIREGYMRFVKCKKPYRTLFAELSVFGRGIYHITCCSLEATHVLCLKTPLDERSIWEISLDCVLWDFSNTPLVKRGFGVITHLWPLRLHWGRPRGGRRLWGRFNSSSWVQI